MELADILLIVIGFFSEVVGTMAGFGSSTIYLPLASYLVDFKTALVLVAIFHLFGNVGRIAFFRHGLDRKVLLVFGLPSFALSLLGATLVGDLSQTFLKLLLGIFLISLSAVFLVRPKIAFPASTKSLVIGGGVSGFIVGLIGTGGALRATFLTGLKIEKEKYIATAAVIALGTDATRIPSYIASGFLTEQYYYLIPVLFAIALGGSYVGRRIVGRIDQAKFRKMVLIAIILASIKFIVDGAVAIQL
ncbi:MAG: sulfite exporter TauE/SafE family protein [Nitrososphaera sp.]|uniref:sulfite exporter TauE/SafE family protein n=1 Tax=Nitrososphaera sp. TaxID=1971748 RepID=UPI00183253FD|nr:sulfite exporter TauE/SafE family protein [Nitrososphaera sp.]NWG36666.1 sulfite exporter TauE/SafE family protein [Nitrososphaera sp.]